MKKLLLFLLLPFSIYSAPIGGPISGGKTGLSSNEVYNIAVNVANSVGGATNGIEKLNGLGTNTTLRNFVGVGSNYITGTTYFGGGNAARFTNGFVTQDSVELGGDAIMLDPGFEFIGTHRGNGQFLTNIPSAAVAGGPFIGKLDDSGTNTTLHNPVLMAPTLPDGNDGIITIGDWAIVPSTTTLDFLELGGSSSVLKLDGDSVIIQEELTVTEQLTVNSGQNPLTIASYGFGSSNHFAGGTRFMSNVWAWAVTTDDSTNSSLSDALVAVDVNGKEVEVVIGSGLSYTAATRTLLNTGGAGSGDTNGISYVEGSDLSAAVRVRRDAGDNHVLDLVWTNNVSALVFTNQDTASSIYYRFMNGFIPLKMTEGGDVSLDSELNLTLHAASVLAFQANLNTRTLNNTNGTTVLDFSGDAVVLDTVNVQQFNIGSMAVTNRLTVTNSIRQPFFELVSTGNETNYTADWAATVPDNNLINATGNVYFSVIDANLVGGVTKQYVITNVYKASSNITAYVQTNLLHLHGQTYTVGASPMHTNYAIPVTNVLVLNLQSVGTTPQSIMSFFVHNQP